MEYVIVFVKPPSLDLNLLHSIELRVIFFCCQNIIIFLVHLLVTTSCSLFFLRSTGVRVEK